MGTGCRNKRQYLESEAVSLLAGPLAEQRFCRGALGPQLPLSARTDQEHLASTLFPGHSTMPPIVWPM
jgi:hypothetical protein